MWRLILLCLTCKAALHGTETQIWLQESLYVELIDNLDGYLFVGQRWDRNVARLHHQYIEAGLVFSCGSWEFIPSFRESYRKLDNKHEPEENPRFAVIKTWEFPRFEILDRNQVEYRSKNEHVLYRNKLVFAFPIDKDFPLTPYVADEIFLKHFTELRQNRLQLGIEGALGDLLVADLRYMFRMTKNDRNNWHGSHAWTLYLFINI